MSHRSFSGSTVVVTYPCTTIHLGQRRKEQRPYGEGDQEYTESQGDGRLAREVIVVGDVRERGGHHGRTQRRDECV